MFKLFRDSNYSSYFPALYHYMAQLSDFTFTFHALEKEMATHSSVLAWRIPGSREPGGLPSMGSHRVGHDWSNLAAAAAAAAAYHYVTISILSGLNTSVLCFQEFEQTREGTFPLFLSVCDLRGEDWTRWELARHFCLFLHSLSLQILVKVDAIVGLRRNRMWGIRKNMI